MVTPHPRAAPGAGASAAALGAHDTLRDPRGGNRGALHGERRVFRCYDARGRILGDRLVRLTADEVAAGAADAVLAARFADPRVALVHVRAVEYGCFLFEAVRTP